jgi:hypothetical protein
MINSWAVHSKHHVVVIGGLFESAQSIHNINSASRIWAGPVPCIMISQLIPIVLVATSNTSAAVKQLCCRDDIPRLSVCGPCCRCPASSCTPITAGRTDVYEPTNSQRMVRLLIALLQTICVILTLLQGVHSAQMNVLNSPRPSIA